uniref:3-methyl-2-oxobutanoate dehydrogenase (2-methylpropanoyl-transferring) n=1 Tax=Ruficoccus amylovorans TaxID=1804625 RepID=A0A842HK35_9BACT|nr:beta-ketoacyl-ACP synthase 3 [Ruficoccus amylovorans]MBC2596024.1 beta-ketoacyl-ACP synthase 3 [Ruficoccus amylovorans]
MKQPLHTSSHIAEGADATSVDAALALYRWMRLSREIERLEARLIKRGEAFFHVECAGHEAMAALAEFLGPQDWLHCHYRDRALQLARGVKPEAIFDALFGNARSSSKGRQLNTMHSDRELHVMTMPTAVSNNLLPAVGVAAEVRDQPEKPLVYCSVGDGGTQQGDFFEAVAEAVRNNLPVLFVVQDNHFALSTVTEGKTFYSLPGGKHYELFGLEMTRLDGRDALAVRDGFKQVCAKMREDRGPALVLLEAERLGSHSNADDQSLYRTPEQIDQLAREADPVALLAGKLAELGVSEDDIKRIDEECRRCAEEAADDSRKVPAPALAPEVKRPLSSHYLSNKEYTGKAGKAELSMRESILEVLRQELETNPAVSLYGEDIEDPKGDAFGVTKGLSTAYPGRVCNSPLAESTIIGTAIGRAMAGGQPVAFVQFADFFPLVYNQFHSELAITYWRSAGEWECPVILMVSCGGYRPGTGPTHTQTMEAIAAHSPGVDVFMPSNAGDAAGMLRAAFASRRPAVFFYPKNLLNNRGLGTSTDIDRHWVPAGRARLSREGTDLTLVGWGNTLPLCEEAAEALDTLGVSSTVIDLRSLSPWDKPLVTKWAEKTGRLVVVHEDSLSYGPGAEICAGVVEAAQSPVAVRRVARPDTYVPFHFPSHLETLPSVRSIVTAAADLLKLELGWKREAGDDDQLFTIEALGVSASDDSVTVAEWLVEPGKEVKVDDVLGVFESDKAAADLLSPQSGTVEEILVEAGGTVRVGTPILRLRVANEIAAAADSARRVKETPYLLSEPEKPAAEAASTVEAPAIVSPKTHFVGISGIASSTGTRQISNAELLKLFPDSTEEKLIRQCGIHSRPWVSKGENVLTLAVDAATRLLSKTDLPVEKLDLIICSTTTPDIATPSLACRLLHAIGGDYECPAFDISAACSGYIYGLGLAHDFLRGRPDARVLMVTSEVMSPLLDMEDYDTAILFGDAATATLLEGPAVADKPKLWLHRPALAAEGETGEFLSVPLPDPKTKISMSGGRVFQKAVRKMRYMLETVCEQCDTPPTSLEGIIPHQANDRILDAVARQLHIEPERVWRNVKLTGNTSSSSIPLCLEENLHRISPGAKYGLVAFGGGYTYAGAIAHGA